MEEFKQLISRNRKKEMSDDIILILKPFRYHPDDDNFDFEVAECYQKRINRDVFTTFQHANHCICYTHLGRLCEIGWIEEYINCVGLRSLLKEKYPTKETSVKVTGNMISEFFCTLEGPEYEDNFIIKKIEEYNE